MLSEARLSSRKGVVALRCAFLVEAENWYVFKKKKKRQKIRTMLERSHGLYVPGIISLNQDMLNG